MQAQPPAHNRLVSGYHINKVRGFVMRKLRRQLKLMVIVAKLVAALLITVREIKDLL